MATIYVDPAASGANDGSSWTDAFTTLQAGMDAISAAGDIVKCRGSETISSPIDVDAGVDGTESTPVQIVGCNGSGTEDGTYYTITATSQTDGINSSTGGSGDYFEWRNIRITNASGDGWDLTGTNATIGNAFINCCSDNNGGEGWNLYYGSNHVFIRCVAHDNTACGWDNNYYRTRWILCESYNNGSHGFGGVTYSSEEDSVIHCISAGNTGDGYADLQRGTIFGSVFDNNGSDGIFTDQADARMRSFILACRLTNNGSGAGYGLNESVAVNVGWCFFSGNDSANKGNLRQITDLTVDGGDGSSTNVTSGTVGYTSPDAPNWNYELTTSATLRNLETRVGGTNGKTDTHIAAGLPVEDLGGGGGGGGSCVVIGG